MPTSTPESDEARRKAREAMRLMRTKKDMRPAWMNQASQAINQGMRTLYDNRPKPIVPNIAPAVASMAQAVGFNPASPPQWMKDARKGMNKVRKSVFGGG